MTGSPRIASCPLCRKLRRLDQSVPVPTQMADPRRSRFDRPQSDTKPVRVCKDCYAKRSAA